jgi:hypothetical protein
MDPQDVVHVERLTEQDQPAQGLGILTPFAPPEPDQPAIAVRPG